MAVVVSVYGKASMAQIKNAEKDLASIKRGVASQSGTWKKFNSVVGSVGKGLMVLGTVAIAGVAIALASMIGFIFKAKAAYEGWMKQVIDMTRLTGLGAAATSKLAGQFELSGVEAKSGTTGVYMFNKALDKARMATGTTATGFSRLHIALKDGEGKWRSMSSLLTEARNKLSLIKDAATRAGVAALLFGKGAKTMLPWLMKSSAEMKKYTGWLKAAGLLMGKKAVAQFKQYREDQKQMAILWKGFQVSAYRALVPLINQIMPTLNKAMGKAVDWLKRFTGLATRKGFTFAADKMIPGFKGLRKTLKDDLIPALKDMAGNIKDLGVVLKPVVERMSELKKAKLDTSWSGNIKALKDNFLGLSRVVGSGTIVAVFSLAFRLMWKVATTIGGAIAKAVGAIWRGIKSTAQTVWNGITGVVGAAWRAIRSVATTIGHSVASTVGAIWRGIKSTAQTVWNGITGVVGAAWRAIRSVASRIGKEVAGTVGAIWRGIKKTAKTVWDGITGVVRTAWGSIAGFVNKIIGAVNTVVTQVNRLAHTSVGTIPLVSTGAPSSTRGNGGAGEEASTGRRVSTPRVMDNEGMGGPLDSIGNALGSAGSWVGDMLGGMGVHWPQPTGGLFGGITGALLTMVKDAVWSFVKQFGGGEGMQIVDFAKSMLGVPYLWGGTSPAGFDCSGLMYWAYAQAGKSIPRVPTNGGRQISRGQIRPADIMFYYPNSLQHGQRVPFGHFKMYAGNNQTIESTTGGVQMRPADWAGAAQIRTYLRLGGAAVGPLSGYLAMLHGRETVVAHDNPTRGLEDLARSGVTNPSRGGDVYIAPGAVQIAFADGTSASPQQVQTYINRAFRDLRAELSRR